MPFMSPSEIDEFLKETRIGVLCTNDLDGAPNGVPIWFEWDGERRCRSTYRTARRALLGR